MDDIRKRRLIKLIREIIHEGYEDKGTQVLKGAVDRIDEYKTLFLKKVMEAVMERKRERGRK